jgi:hypothetical protein
MASVLVAGSARADDAVGPVEQTPPLPPLPALHAVEGDPYATDAFACRGRAETLAKDVDPQDVRHIMNKKLLDAQRPDETLSRQADDYCIAAELAWRLGSADAVSYYERAIALAPMDPGYDYLLAHYYRWLHGATLLQSAEAHYQAALRKLADLQRRHIHRDQDDTLVDWLQRDMQELYQTDGLPLLRGKAYPYGATESPGVSLIGRFQYNHDTSDFWHSNETRAFTTEALFSASSQRLDRPLTRAELYGIIIAPSRLDAIGKLRLRLDWFGSIDFGYHWFEASKAQITSFYQPDVFNDVKFQDLNVAYQRTLNLYPLFDLNLLLNYQSVTREGFVEFLPHEVERYPIYLSTVTLSRKLGPDVLQVGGTYVYMNIPDYTDGPLDERKRGESIRAITADYAIYRSLIFPWSTNRTNTRGWHWYGGTVYDDAVWGTRAVQQRTFYGGTNLLGLGGTGLWDLNLQGTYVDSHTTDAGTGLDPQQTNGQVRLSSYVVRRLVDDQAPGVLKPVAGIFYPANLSLVVPVVWDQRAEGPNFDENARVGAELWYRDADPVTSAELLINVGYGYQYFYRIQRQVNDVHVDVRLGGW